MQSSVKLIWLQHVCLSPLHFRWGLVLSGIGLTSERIANPEAQILERYVLVTNEHFIGCDSPNISTDGGQCGETHWQMTLLQGKPLERGIQAAVAMPKATKETMRST